MAKRPLKRVLVIDPVLLSEDEADYLISRSRERTERSISLKEFLKQHPKDVAWFVKQHGRLPGKHVESRTNEIRPKRIRRAK